jgi:hypothetical protein
MTDRDADSCHRENCRIFTISSVKCAMLRRKPLVPPVDSLQTGARRAGCRAKVAEILAFFAASQLPRDGPAADFLQMQRSRLSTQRTVGLAGNLTLWERAGRVGGQTGGG